MKGDAGSRRSRGGDSSAGSGSAGSASAMASGTGAWPLIIGDPKSSSDVAAAVACGRRS